MKNMIDVSEEELNKFLAFCTVKTFKRQDFLTRSHAVADEIYFINKGLVRVLLTDNNRNEHSIHFAFENQFITDYASYLQKQASIYSLQALEVTEALILPRAAIDWGYANLKEGQKMGRLIAEYYYIYQDERIKNTYIRSPKERFDNISQVFYNIHNRVPQHMIASYLGITPVHLSRLKKDAK